MFSLDEIYQAHSLVQSVLPPTPQYVWPLLSQRLGIEVIVKHENHLPTGAFKVRGGLVYLDRLIRRKPAVRGVISATRGNHGQSIAYAARRVGLPATIVVPVGNSPDKNAAMRALGAELIEVGNDFDEARAELGRLAEQRGYEPIPSFHRDLVIGVATYALELFTAQPDLDTVYVPIGLGSGICGLIRTRDLLGLKTTIVGVVSERAAAYARSFEAGRAVTTPTAWTFADGIATRQPDGDALEVILAGAARVVEVSEREIAAAIRIFYDDIHNLAEGAGAAALAGMIQDLPQHPERRCGVILCGGNLDRHRAVEILAGGVPEVRPGESVDGESGRQMLEMR
ncbi:MAG: threonine dehydratase [Planctomycetaceae bacterium]|nr:MAG: threonine dehydratase [Planctomycetaceae bacterium]